MKTVWNWVQAAFAAVGGFLGWFLGGPDGFLYALIAFVAIDYLTGVMCAIADRKLSSEVGAKGIFKKVLIFVLAGVGHIIDSQVLVSGGAIRTAVIFFYLSNEGLQYWKTPRMSGCRFPKNSRRSWSSFMTAAKRRKKNEPAQTYPDDKPDGREVCVHAFIGKLADGTIATYQTLPWNMRGWHCGGSGNDTHIGFEICEDGLTDSVYFNAVYRESAELCAYLCREYGLTEKNVICHSEGYKLGIASNHSDVMHWFPRFGKSMDAFRADVKKLLDTAGNPKTYIVQKGESLWGIARKQLGSGARYPEIMSLNNLSSTAIYPGQVLKIPK